MELSQETVTENLRGMDKTCHVGRKKVDEEGV